MNKEPNLYKVLQIDVSAEPEVIQAAYRRLAKKYHPDTDRSPTATLHMQEINYAYDILSDPQKRIEYDLRRSSDQQSESQPSKEQTAQQRAAEARKEEQEHAKELEIAYDEAVRWFNQRQWAEAIRVFEQIEAVDAVYRDVKSKLTKARQELSKVQRDEKEGIRQEFVTKTKKEDLKRQKRSVWIVFAVIAFMIVGILAIGFWLTATSFPSSSTHQANVPIEDAAARNGKYSAAPPMTIDTAKSYYATFKTAQGDIKTQLYADRTPLTVNNFVFLAREGFYDNTTFHRVLDGFMAQAGDPTGTGAGGPGYTFADEFGPGLVFDRPGLLAMANAGPNTNGSQFFITFDEAPHLNGRHTIFGEVIEGQEVLDKLTRRDPQTDPSVAGDALYSVVIEESEESALPEPTPQPPTPTPFSPSQLDGSLRPLATMTATARSNYFNTPPTQQVIENKIYTSTIVTSQGVMTVELRADLAPIAVNNFVVLADLGFYDNTPINLISPSNFIILGSPGNNPDSDAGYALSPEMNLPVAPKQGFLAYVPKTNDPSRASSSQLFLTLGQPGPETVAQYSFFGRITDGIEVLSRLTTTDTVEAITVAR